METNEVKKALETFAAKNLPRYSAFAAADLKELNENPDSKISAYVVRAVSEGTYRPFIHARRLSASLPAVPAPLSEASGIDEEYDPWKEYDFRKELGESFEYDTDPSEEYDFSGDLSKDFIFIDR